MDIIFGKENFKNEIIWHYRRWPAKTTRFQRMHDVILFYVKEEEHNTFNVQLQPLTEGTNRRWNGKKSRVDFINGVRQLTKKTDEESLGTPLDDVWNIPVVNSQAKERLGYPTQKPLALLDMKYRLKDSFPGISFKVIGEPTDIGAARQLADDDRYQFQWWALSLIAGAMPLGGQEGSREGKKGSDKGIDGVLTFIDDASNKAKRALIQVKSGHVGSSMIRDLIGTVQREQATLGVFVTLENPTKDMVVEALTAGFYNSPGWKKKYPMIQIHTVDELLHKAEVNMPPRYWWGKKAKVLKTYGEQKVLDLMPRMKRSIKQNLNTVMKPSIKDTA